MKTITIVLAVSAVTLLGTAGFIYSGLYNIGADEPHNALTFSAIETLRDRSISVHARGLVVPSLTANALIAEGAEHYAGMCTGCHLAPGIEQSALRKGLYPQPPKLAEPNDLSPAEQFWVIKHGLKMTGMPAWGATHSDEEIWGMVAFLQQLPRMTPAQYQALTADSDEHDETEAAETHAHQHSHQHQH